MSAALRRFKEQLRDDWDAFGRPPWYTWPFLVVPFLIWNYWFSKAALILLLAILLLVAAISTGAGWFYVGFVVALAVFVWALCLGYVEFVEDD